MVLASPVFFLVYPLTKWQAERSLEVLCDLGGHCGTCVRHGLQDHSDSCAIAFSTFEDDFLEPSTASSWWSRAGGRGDAGSLTPRCLPTCELQ